MKHPLLCPFVEASFRGPTWVNVPDQPWPDFICLGARTPYDEVAIVVYVLATHILEPHQPPRLADELPAVAAQLPGGLLIVSSETTIAPSCCFSLHDWRAWRQAIDGTGVPWLGHKPSPRFERALHGVTIWPTGGLGEPRATDEIGIYFTYDRLERALEGVEQDLRAFSGLLGSWCEANAPAISLLLPAAFLRAYVSDEPPNPSLQRTRFARR